MYRVCSFIFLSLMFAIITCAALGYDPLTWESKQQNLICKTAEINRNGCVPD
jgi:hypothetical protein